MEQQQLVNQAKELAGGTSAKLAAMIGWSKPSVDAWCSNREMPDGARILLTLMVELPQVREWMWSRKLQPQKPGRKKKEAK